MTPLVSVIVPLLGDREAARQLIARIPVDLRVEIVIAEAGHEPGLESLSQGRPGITLIHTTRGRGGQMNAGARLARGEWLLFLHADSHLPSDWLDLFQAISPTPEPGTESDPGSRRLRAKRSGEPRRSLAEAGVPGPGSRVPAPEIIGGWFQFALDDPAWQARLIERSVAWRVRLFQLPLR